MRIENDYRLIERLAKRNSRRRLLKRGLALLSAVVLLLTVNTLKLKVVAMEHTPTCGCDYEHVHTGECFDEEGNLICPLHEHTDACFQEAPAPEEEEIDLGLFEDDGLIEIEDGQTALGADETLANGEAEIPAAYEFDMAGRSQVMLSEVLAMTLLPVDPADIQMVGLVDDEGLGEEPVAVALVDEDIAITALSAFDAAEIAIVTSEEILTVMLLNGAPEAADEEPTEVDNDADAETEDAGKDIDADLADIPADVTEPDLADEAEQDIEGEAGTTDDAPVEELGEQDLGDIAGDADEDAEEDADEDATDGAAEDAIIEENNADAAEEADDADAAVAAEPVEDGEDDASATGADGEEAEEAVADESAEPQDGDEEEQTEVDNAADTEGVGQEEQTEVENKEDDEAAETEADGEESEQADEESEQADEASEQADEESEQADEASEQADEESEQADEESEQADEESEQADEESEQADETEETDEEAAEAAPELTAEEMLAALYPAQSFEAHAENVRVDVTAEVGAFPEGTEMRVTPVWDDDTLDGIADTVAEDFVEVKKVLAVDIAFFNADGEEIEPLQPISVVMTVEEIAENQDAVVVHMDDDGNTEVVEQSEAAQSADDQLALNVELPAAQDAQAQTEQILAEAMATDEAEEAEPVEETDETVADETVTDETVADETNTDDAANDEAEATEAVDDADNANNIENTDNDDSAENADDDSAAVDAPAEEARIEYGSEVEDAAPAPAEEALEVLAEAVPTESVAFEADAFSVYAVVVTETIETRYIAADGASFTVTVGYGPEALIPAGSELAVEEIPQDSEAWEEYRDASKVAMNQGDESTVSAARFFDIEIVSEGQKVEPAAPVEVNIRYDDALELDEGAALSVVHFADEGTEVIRDVELSEDGTQITYQQASFSITGTVITSPSNAANNGAYMLILKQGNEYYMVMNNGVLEPVQLINNGSGFEVAVVYPMLWTYEAEEFYGQHHYLVHRAFARTTNDQQFANTWYNQYINPNESSGISDPDVLPSVPGDEHTQLQHDATNAQKRLDSRIVIDGNKIRSENSGNFIAVSGSGKDATMVGRASRQDAAEVIFARVDQLYSETSDMDAVTMARRSIVNHIDISIRGTAELKVPLANGKYFDEQGREVLNVTSQNKVTLSLSKDVPVTEDDIKEAVLTSYVKGSDGKRTIVDDAYYISGYSGNAPREGSEGEGSTAQVRIEGRFKVSNIGREIEQGSLWYDNGTRTDYSRVNDADLRERLEKRIYYKVSTKKDVVFDLVYSYVDEQTNTVVNVPLYDARGNKLTTHSKVELSASFDYWDTRNECPPVHKEWDPTHDFYDEWRRGLIPLDNWGNSGMDFKLGSSEEGENNSVAVAVTKYIVDEAGNTIPMADETTCDVEIWHKPLDYSNPSNPVYVKTQTDKIGRFNVDSIQNVEISNANLFGTGTAPDRFIEMPVQQITVGTNGTGSIYDYSIDPGMVCVRERSFPAYIMDATGKRWNYKYTYLKTQYVKRNSSETSDEFHMTQNYTKAYEPQDKRIQIGDGEYSYLSVPEVLGAYKFSDGSDRFNDSLQFFIYNVYEPDDIEVEVEKKWKKGNADVDPDELPSNAEVDVFLKRFKLAYKDGYDPIVDNVIKARIDIYQDNYGHNTRYSNATDFEAGNTVTVSYRRKYNEPGGYSVNGGAKVPFTVYSENNKPDCDSGGFISEAFTVEIPEDGVLNIALDDYWGEIKEVHVVRVGESINVSRAVRRRLVSQQQDNDHVVAPPAPYDKPYMEYVVDDAFDEVKVELRSGNEWKDKATELDAYDENGNAYLYFINRVEERNVPDGTKIEIDFARDGSTLTSVGDTTLTVTNQLPTSVNLQKTDENDEPLVGAKFSLSMKVGGEWTTVEGYGEIDLSDTSRATLSGLFGGRYKLTETQAPDGHYILHKSVYFTIQDGVVALTDENGAAADSAAYDGKITLSADTISVQNPEGARLPNTGGAGTGAYTLVGAAMALLALALLLAKRRASQPE